MKQCLKFGKDLMQQPSNQEMLSMKLPMVLLIAELNTNYKRYLQTPPFSQQSLLQPQSLKLPDFEVVNKICSLFGEFKILNNLDNCLVNGLGILRAYKSKEAHFTITIINNEGKKFTSYPLAFTVVQLTCLTNHNVMNCQITDMKDGSFHASYTLNCSGNHLIMIMIEGKSFPSSPFEINVLPPYATVGLKCREIIEFGEQGHRNVIKSGGYYNFFI